MWITQKVVQNAIILFKELLQICFKHTSCLLASHRIVVLRGAILPIRIGYDFSFLVYWGLTLQWNKYVNKQITKPRKCWKLDHSPLQKGPWWIFLLHLVLRFISCHILLLGLAEVSVVISYVYHPAPPKYPLLPALIYCSMQFKTRESFFFHSPFHNTVTCAELELIIQKRLKIIKQLAHFQISRDIFKTQIKYFKQCPLWK